AGFDLPGFLRPSYGLPFQDKIAERLNPLVGACLPPPHIEKVNSMLRVDPHHNMCRVVPAALRHCIVRRPGDPKRLKRGKMVNLMYPFALEIVAGLRGWALLIERGPVPRRQSALNLF